MTFLVDANFLSEPTKVAPSGKVVEWLTANKRNLVVDSIVLRKLNVGDESGAAPQTREEKHRHHSRGQKTPPQPIAGNAVGVDQSSDHQRRVRGKGRRHHRGSREPPGNVPAGHEIVFRTLARAAAEVQAKD